MRRSAVSTIRLFTAPKFRGGVILKRNLGFKIFYFVTALVVILNTAVSVKNNLFFDINSLPDGSLTQTISSPDGKHTLKLYSISNSLGAAVRGELVSGGKETNVFWQTGLDSVEARWVDNNNVIIDGMPLDVVHGAVYDCRRGSSIMQEGSIDENFAPVEQQTP